MGVLGFGQFRTLKLKVPRVCCLWCERHDKYVTDQVKALQEKVAEIEADSNLFQATLLDKLKVETSNYILKRLTDGPAPVYPDPSQFAQICLLYQQIVDMVPGTVPESNRLLENGRLKVDGAALRALKEGTGILPPPSNPVRQPQGTSA